MSTLNGAWGYNGTYFPDYWEIRRYHRGREMDVHSDTGNFGRCLSATLHLGGPGEEAVVEGGEFRTHRCREGDCLSFGWRYDKAAGRPPDRTLLRAENLETVAEVPYEPG